MAPSAAGPAPSFAGPKNYPTGRGPDSVAIGDLNGDGKADLATANVPADTLSVLLNRGNGGYARKRDYRTGQWPLSVEVGDLNGDGKRDLATANRDARTVSVLLNAPGGPTEPDVSRTRCCSAT